MGEYYESRREFLGKVGVALPATAVLGCAAGVAAARDESVDRRIVPGSPSPNYSRAVAFGPLVFAAGVVGQVPGSGKPISTDFAEQCRQAMENLKDAVEEAGSGMDKVLQCTCYLTEAADFGRMNAVYVSYFPKDPPARSTVVVKELVVPGAKLEIDCVACLG